MDGGNERHALTQSRSDVVGVRQTAGEQDGINLSAERNGLCADTLGHAVNHGVEYQPRTLVAGFDAREDFAHIRCAEPGHQSGLTGNARKKFAFAPLAAETQPHQVGGREGTGTFGREGAVAVQPVVDIDALAVTMRPDGDAATHVGDDEVEVFVAHPLNFGMTAGGGALIEGVPDADARHFGTAAEVSLGQHLVDDLGIGHQGRASRQLRSERRRDVATEVTRVLTNGRARVAQHGFVHCIDPGGNGMREATARDDGIEIEGVGLIQTLKFTASPVLIPPSIPPL